MFSLRRFPVHGGASPLYENKYVPHFHALTILTSTCWLTASTGVILHHVWNESCIIMMEYLLIMSIVCLVTLCGFVFIACVPRASDTDWIGIFSALCVKIIGGSISLGWGLVRLSREIKICSISAPRTYFYSCSFTVLYAITLVMTSIIVFIVILPSLLIQSHIRSRII